MATFRGEDLPEPRLRMGGRKSLMMPITLTILFSGVTRFRMSMILVNCLGSARSVPSPLSCGLVIVVEGPRLAFYRILPRTVS